MSSVISYLKIKFLFYNSCFKIILTWLDTALGLQVYATMPGFSTWSEGQIQVLRLAWCPSFDFVTIIKYEGEKKIRVYFSPQV